MHKSLSNTVSLEVILTQNIREIRKLIIWKKKRFKKKKSEIWFLLYNQILHKANLQEVKNSTHTDTS